jgi:hypothetical protein
MELPLFLQGRTIILLRNHRAFVKGKRTSEEGLARIP